MIEWLIIKLLEHEIMEYLISTHIFAFVFGGLFTYILLKMMGKL